MNAVSSGPNLVQSPRLGFATGEEIAEQQGGLLRQHIEFLAANSPYYRQRFSELGLDARDIRTLTDLPRLPLTGKEDLARHAAKMIAVPDVDLVDLCLTSGTTGPAVALPQSRRDLERVAYNEETAFRMAGVSADDRVLLAVALDRCFMAGLAYFLGLARIGALAIRAGTALLPALAELVLKQRPTAIVGVPTLLLRLAADLEAQGVDVAALGVRRMICIGEPVRGADLKLSRLGGKLAEAWGATVFGTYASTEMATAFTDCEYGIGGHLLPDLMIVEIVDEDGLPLPPGEVGEVVATPLQVTGMPLLRFRTGDLARLHSEPCACGRQTPRLGPIVGRKAEMLKVKGVTVFPQAIHTALQDLEGLAGCCLEVRSDYEQSDLLTVVVGLPDGNGDAASIADVISARTRVRPEVRIVTPDIWREMTWRSGRRKPQLFFDYRAQKLRSSS